tara:strand:+ start:1077 stop:1754 length:678 start_codon:yes stop_codon:yes gene_type:complete
MKKYFRDVSAIIWKDILSEFRTREMFSSMFLLAVLILIIFTFSIDLSKVKSLDVAPGILWVSFVFAGTIGLNRSFLNEQENDCLLGMMVTPMDRSAIYVGKMIGNFIFMTIMEIFLIPVFVVFFNLSFQYIIEICLITFMGTLGFVALGTLMSAMSASFKTREIMLPILLYPLIVPVVIASVKATGALLHGRSLESVMTWLKLLMVFDIIFLIASFIIFEYIIEE